MRRRETKTASQVGGKEKEGGGERRESVGEKTMKVRTDNRNFEDRN